MEEFLAGTNLAVFMVMKQWEREREKRKRVGQLNVLKFDALNNYEKP